MTQLESLRVAPAYAYGRVEKHRGQSKFAKRAAWTRGVQKSSPSGQESEWGMDSDFPRGLQSHHPDFSSWGTVTGQKVVAQHSLVVG